MRNLVLAIVFVSLTPFGSAAREIYAEAAHLAMRAMSSQLADGGRDIHALKQAAQHLAPADG